MPLADKVAQARHSIEHAKLVFEIMFVIIAVMFVCLGWPLAKRKVPRNGMYGVRTPLTRSQDGRWYRVNETFGYGQMVSGVVLFVAALSLTRLNFFVYQGVLLMSLVLSVYISYSVAVNKERRRPE